jgi:hypothetical protein
MSQNIPFVGGGLHDIGIQTPSVEREVPEENLDEYVYPGEWENVDSMWFAWPPSTKSSSSSSSLLPSASSSSSFSSSTSSSASIKDVIEKMINTVAPVVKQVYIVCDKNKTIEVMTILPLSLLPLPRLPSSPIRVFISISLFLFFFFFFLSFDPLPVHSHS